MYFDKILQNLLYAITVVARKCNIRNTICHTITLRKTTNV